MIFKEQIRVDPTPTLYDTDDHVNCEWLHTAGDRLLFLPQCRRPSVRRTIGRGEVMIFMEQKCEIFEGCYLETCFDVMLPL